ncbi:hypothetical protein [Nocardioides sp. TF02-7]|uniref:hypothetical protein n=1 Tax=Nocardioides sp. TF02-7 TaxID=2917724 RepID=UPI001F06AB82|nr:hypothetical protein [Nocardioides sp. TF02-7]UMG93293.1 hypothetical protein MF408_03150 [Nocardioides sp. TF02-7]
MRLLRSLLVVALALLLVPIGASPARADDSSVTGIALDPTGKPLPNVHWELYTWEGGEWTTLQFGPKLTDSEGRFTYDGVEVGGQYRICFSDSYYDVDFDASDGEQVTLWQPEVRHRDTCWRDADSHETAETWSPPADEPSATLPVTLPEQGFGMAAVNPFVVGTYLPGEPLTVVGQELWQPTNAAFRYQWMAQRDGSLAEPIPGATSATFIPTAELTGAWVFARVTASRPGYKPVTLPTPLSQVGTDRVPATAPLTVSGAAEPGSTLTASFGLPAGTRSELTWYVDGVPQPAATAYDSETSTFQVSAAHAGARIDARLRIHETDPEGNYDGGTDTFQRVQVQVAGSRPVEQLPEAPAPTGRAEAGRFLAAPTGLIADPEATARYQWLRDGAPIEGATASRYQVRRADEDKQLSVHLTISRPGWWTEHVTTSAATTVARTLQQGKVAVVGKARVGKRLTARTPGWGPRPVKVRYQWLRNGKLVRGATKARYQVRKVDRRKVLKVRVTVTKPGYPAVTKASKGRKIKR